MAIDLNSPTPLDPEDQDVAPLLADLQGNILKWHGRDHTAQVFLRFREGAATAVKAFIKSFAERYVTSAAKQLKEAELYNRHGIVGDLFGNFYLSARGYENLGFTGTQVPQDSRFLAGMKASREDLNDPAPGDWEEWYRGDIHAMILLADDILPALNREVRRVLTELKEIADVLTIERGSVLRNNNEDPIEHFGYVDGISDPLFLKGDIEKADKSGRDKWDPLATLSLALVPDPNGPDDSAFGSYLAFRKLEQNVRGFEMEKERLADALGLKDKQRERAGALVVGRFEDGTPVTAHQEGQGDPGSNNFDYSEDDGSRCPFHAHIRKTNPRGDSVGTDRYGRRVAADLEAERAHRVVRRGIPYGKREVEPKDNPALEELPTGGVGLLFMCFQSDIGNQFEFIQKSFSNDPDFPQRGTGPDPLTGQGPSQAQEWPLEHGQPATAHFDFQRFVTLRGGEYFFAPSLAFLKSIDTIATPGEGYPGSPY
jgi:Dyp-type peroxidase family